MRSVLTHAYFGVDLKIVWHTIVEDLSAALARGRQPHAAHERHRLRSACLSLLNHTVMSISGHSSTRMLERYTHPTLERRIVALDTFTLSTAGHVHLVHRMSAKLRTAKKRQPKLPHLLSILACQP
jgi:hypothetical protein